jgi:anti-sigma B factor antagonist
MIRPSEFKVEVEHGANAATLIVTGEIDIATVGQLEQAREDALAHDPRELLIDLRGVTFIDSSGLKFVLQTHQLSQELEWRLQILRPDEHVMKVFTLIGADERLPFLEADGK